MVRAPIAARPAPRLDPYQEAVAAHPGGPLLVLAGPGTGKTTTLVEAVARRTEGGTAPERVLVLTFGRKAAGELRERLGARGPAAALVPVTTFHSLAYALVRAHQDPELFAEPLRLLSGPEQDLMVRELLTGEAEAGAAEGLVRWPDELRAALTTRGFADEVRAVLARTRELGLGPAALGGFAARAGRPDWRAAAQFLTEYLDVLDQRGVVDYAELMHRAVLLAEQPEVRERLRGAYDAVFVDEYQDTDPGQVRLLSALAGDGRDLVAVGDPDQSIYAFRGADVNGILDFPERFPAADGRPAPIRVLRVNRRASAAVLDAARQVAARMPLGRLPAAAARAHRAPVALRETEPGGARSASLEGRWRETESGGARSAFPEGRWRVTESGGARSASLEGRWRETGGPVEAYTYPTPGAEVDNIADLLRRAHLEEGVRWSDMAVLVRAGGRSIPVMRRALTAAGVPVEVDGDDLPLHAEPAVAPLLTALRVAIDPDALTAETARQLLTSPLGGLDPSDLRRLGRELRDEERSPEGAAASGAGEAEPDPVGPTADSEIDAGPDPTRGAGNCASEGDRPDAAEQPLADMAYATDDTPAPAQAGVAVPPAEELVRRALAEPSRLTTLEHGRAAHRLGTLLLAARRTLAEGGTAYEALWALWDGTPWPQRLERAALRRSAAADRDLDAVCALFETAERSEVRTGHRGALNFLAELEAQDIAADTLSRRIVRPDAVRLLTAHRAKGLEWELVVVASVQEGLWPDPRRRGSLLDADRIGPRGLSEPLTPGALLAEERRLFYVAVTRARSRLVVTAVAAAAEDGDRPSRFLEELGVEPVAIPGRPRRALSVSALVAELRAATVDPAAAPELRDAAARRLAKLAALEDEDGFPMVPAAHPDRWWGLAEPTRSEVPVRDPGEPVALSPSALEQLRECPLQWFLQKEARADRPSTAAQGFGSVVHALADEVGSGTTPADLDVLLKRLDTVWDALAFDAPWKSVQEREEARGALERFVHWHVAERGRSEAGTEHPFDVTLSAGGTRVRIRGVMDRVERGDADGLAYVVDFKTGRNAPSGPQVAEHPQLAVYQLAVREGAVDDLPAFAAGRPEPGGAELVQLRKEASKQHPELPKVQRQDAPLDGPDTWIERLLTEAAGRVLSERFGPRLGDRCGTCSVKRACSEQPEGRQLID
ncbi:DNA helicase UvrD [Mangrovactinospora gilvigrisea]|uniref:DNA 3'-5' helicase n=1 Tax=Mangrovactinospora gilvigrisea TaxID=1428644 RepID=A0A1J7C5X2_9ACTN|nr:ATP-dependent DNA helicase [Mangrovactinospora gilvigrisea]OIV36932.1 DNA helicase UvrD [Mangrovactinospora gilvigrisea]